MIDQFDRVHNDDLKPIGFGLPGIILYEINEQARLARENSYIQESISRRLARENA